MKTLRNYLIIVSSKFNQFFKERPKNIYCKFSSTSDDEDNDGLPDDDPGMTEIRFVPEDKTQLDPMFQAMTACQALHPDPDQSVDPDSEEEEEEENGDEEEGMFDDAEEDQQMDQDDVPNH